MEFLEMPIVLMTLLLFLIFDSTFGLLFKDIKLTYCDNKRVDNSSLLYAKEAMSSLECGAVCAQDSNCLSARYRKREKICDCFSKGHRYFDNKCGCLEDHIDYGIIYKDHPCYFYMPVNATGSCVCDDGFTGDMCENPPRDCSDFNKFSTTDFNKNYIYFYPETCQSFDAFCASNRLLVFWSGGEYNTKHSWEDFKTTFFDGKIYWWGNEQTHTITNQMYNYTLLISQPLSPQVESFRLFNHFYIENETNNYALRYTLTNGFVTDGHVRPDNLLTDGMQFHTFDHNDEEGCVATHKAAFWYDINCTYPSPLLRKYPFGGLLENVSEVVAVILRETGDVVTTQFEQSEPPFSYFVSNLTKTN